MMTHFFNFVNPTRCLKINLAEKSGFPRTKPQPKSDRLSLSPLNRRLVSPRLFLVYSF
jgi:hypothetical protein